MAEKAPPVQEVAAELADSVLQEYGLERQPDQALGATFAQLNHAIAVVETDGSSWHAPHL
eukprot:CAMPEP_0197690208 /NCGR_PEP_ID=MMETSP1338-20131121/108026_1 /TAXON_ID=43686 ORGANISM="Pelagodinium beii, Strain RCC1491" /NCGR_SAMPLE_ID=MMETSP1338 /ASSEMBLY_ACC=CAM_ASM_000754 /LENGTH=59 /DNA_ID=CAMNT_0043272629 /DNA_START=132 /DNA_END=309 /DNA_ORIENTATION=+